MHALDIAANILVALVALLHAWFLVLEMFLWDRPAGMNDAREKAAAMGGTHVVFLKTGPKYDAIVDDIRESYERGQPALVGTASIEMSELLDGLLNKAGIPHEVLNAKQHEREAHIVAQAGRPKAITIATNMASLPVISLNNQNTDHRLRYPTTAPTIALGGVMNKGTSAINKPSHRRGRVSWSGSSCVRRSMPEAAIRVHVSASPAASCQP